MGRARELRGEKRRWWPLSLAAGSTHIEEQSWERAGWLEEGGGSPGGAKEEVIVGKRRERPSSHVPGALEAPSIRKALWGYIPGVRDHPHPTRSPR